MAVNDVGSSSSLYAPEGTQVEKKVGNQQLGREDFMKLLVAQLKNQDPNNPVDTKEMVTQLSQLTSVEQLVAMSEKLDKLASATTSAAANSSSGLIGKTVSGTANTITLGPTGGGQAAVNFKQNAETVTVSVKNDAGRVVRKMQLDKTAAGTHAIEWDGKTDGGERATPGKYTFEIDAKDKNDTPIESDMTVSGIVSGVSYENGTPELVIGNTRVPLSNVTSISQ